MSLLGAIANAAGIALGGGLGLLLKGGLKEKYRTMLNHTMALAVLFVGIAGALPNMLAEEASPILYVVSLVVGGLVGELLGIETLLEKLGQWLQAKMKAGNGQSSFSKGFVAASILFCTGTMSILGSIQSGTQGLHTILLTKSLMDGIISLVMASTLGVGVLFSALSILLYEGALTLLSSSVSPYLTADMLRELSIVGGVVITAMGLNMLELTKIRVANLIPAMFIPILYYLALGLFA